MNNSLTPINHAVPLDLDGPASWQTVNYWAGMASRFQHASVASQVMAGFALNELHKASRIKPGNPKLCKKPNVSQLPNDSVVEAGRALSWPEMVEQHAGISDDTARNWMGMADAIKSKWKKLAPQARLKALMSQPTTEWKDEDVKLVSDAVHKVTDGKSQLEFMWDLGIAKKPRGAGATGREKGCDGTKKKLSLSEVAELRRQQARSDWARMEVEFKAYTDKFLLLPDSEVTAQIALLEQALNARKAWLKQPLNERDADAISQML